MLLKKLLPITLLIALLLLWKGIRKDSAERSVPSTDGGGDFSKIKVRRNSTQQGTSLDRPKNNLNSNELIDIESNKIYSIVEKLIASESARAKLIKVQESKISPRNYFVYVLGGISASEQESLINLAMSAEGLRDNGYGEVQPWSEYLISSFGLKNAREKIRVEIIYDTRNEVVKSNLIGFDSAGEEVSKHFEEISLASDAAEGKYWRFSHLLDFDPVVDGK